MRERDCAMAEDREQGGGEWELMREPAPEGGSCPLTELRENTSTHQRTLVRRYALPNGNVRTSIFERVILLTEYQFSDCGTRAERVVVAPHMAAHAGREEARCMWCNVPERLLDMFIMRSQVVRIVDNNADSQNRVKTAWPLREGAMGVTLRYLFDCFAEFLKLQVHEQDMARTLCKGRKLVYGFHQISLNKDRQGNDYVNQYFCNPGNP